MILTISDSLKKKNKSLNECVNGKMFYIIFYIEFPTNSWSTETRQVKDFPVPIALLENETSLTKYSNKMTISKYLKFSVTTLSG